MRFSFIDWKNKDLTNKPTFTTLMSLEERLYLEEAVGEKNFEVVGYPETGDQNDLNIIFRKVNVWVKHGVK